MPLLWEKKINNKKVPLDITASTIKIFKYIVAVISPKVKFDMFNFREEVGYAEYTTVTDSYKL